MAFSPFGGAGILFTIVPVIVMFGFGLVCAMILVNVVRGGMRWKKNNHSPVLTVDATVTAKRIDVRHRRYGEMQEHGYSSTTYYATFEVESGDRIELEIQDREYGLLAERDRGKLTFQGTRYQGFQRD